SNSGDEAWRRTANACARNARNQAEWQRMTTPGNGFLVDRTQEVGGSSPPSSIVKGLQMRAFFGACERLFLWITRRGQVLVKFATSAVPDDRPDSSFWTSFLVRRASTVRVRQRALLAARAART